MAPITYDFIEFKEKIVEYKDLKTFRPSVPGDGWYYLGPVAVANHDSQTGIIVKANDPSALDEVVEWEPVFLDIEQKKFSTWRGIPRTPDLYVVIGHFFVTGLNKPTHEQTVNIRAIRKDLISEQEPNHLIWKQRLPKAVLSLWNATISDRLHFPTGAFVSKDGEDASGLHVGLLRFIT